MPDFHSISTLWAMILLGFRGEVHCEFENSPPRGVAGKDWQERFQVEGYRFQLAVPLLPPEGAFQRLPKPTNTVRVPYLPSIGITFAWPCLPLQRGCRQTPSFRFKVAEFSIGTQGSPLRGQPWAE